MSPMSERERRTLDLIIITLLRNYKIKKNINAETLTTGRMIPMGTNSAPAEVLDPVITDYRADDTHGD